ncbi:MAG: glycoside hydrolase [Armatimonadetes bacterium]|nr:glycoside hydrolase [Armatimonadota bacterium]
MLLGIASMILLQTQVHAVTPSMTDCLKWRNIGPFRGGRTVGACGIADQPNTFFMGVNNGGVWKTTDAGRTWKPIFDDQPTGSIGDVMVAPSDPKVIYVGSGEGLQRPDLSTGDGIYRSGDGGKTWAHIGLRDAQQIGGLCVDKRDANRVFVAALGHPYGPNEERGVFRTLDKGKSWKKVLYSDENTGAVQVTIDPNDSQTIYADMWEARLAPWENGFGRGPGSGLFKSTDGGDTWKRLNLGLPETPQGVGRIGFAIAPSNSKILYATVEPGGVYRSNDAGMSWKKVNDEGRINGRGDDFAEVCVDPTDAETLYAANTSLYRSTDGGVNFTCIKGSPGGDDYHRLWINPKHPEIIMAAADQGASISVNHGETWSSWYNQATAQFYHVITDNAFPYNVIGGQQESGSAMVSSRGNDGQITFREWHPVGGDEYAYFAPDLLNPRYMYGGRVNRYDKVTGEVVDIRPKGSFRTLRTAPLIFSPVDKKTLFFGGNILFKTIDGGKNWDTISPDLSRETWDIPESVGKFTTPEMKTMPRRGVIYTIAPSPLDLNLIWCGTDDGLIWVTKNQGKNWENVTPKAVTSWSKVSMIDASHFSKGTAYAAVNRIRCDDLKPHIYRTQDFGKTWKEIVSGLPASPINSVREDHKNPNLLVCASELAVSFSNDAGSNWHSLRNNMPATSVRDIVIHEDDLVIGTHGRGFWIMDNFSMLRNLPEATSTTFFAPQPAYVLERNTNTDTPLPPDEPRAQNPPDGAMLDYYLPQGATKVTIEVVSKLDSQVVYQIASNTPVVPVDPKSLTVMPGWVRPESRPGTTKGSHRFVWDLRLAAKGGRSGLPISAVWGDTPLGPQGPFVAPGEYEVRITIENTSGEKRKIGLLQPLEVRADPRKAN